MGKEVPNIPEDTGEELERYKVYKIPKEIGEKLEKYFDKRQYPYVKRESAGEFVVMVHSKPFGKAPLSEKERKKREEAKENQKAAAKEKKILSAQAKADAANERIKELEEED